MTEPDRFFKTVLDSLNEQIAVLDTAGVIRYVNDPWIEFCNANEGPRGIDWIGVNYLDACEHAAGRGDEQARLAADGIRGLIASSDAERYLEYPCHGPSEERWFVARMTPMHIGNQRYVVVSHHDITERKLAEQRVIEMSRVDGLTEIANRQRFDAVLHHEWRRAMRSGTPLSLLLLDVDCFKAFNDYYGHLAGDDCLRRVARVLDATVNRAADLVARYGGEEFALLLGESSPGQGETIAARAVAAVRELGIEHAASAAVPRVTVSAGVATMAPRRHQEPDMLVTAADEALYRAKAAGRNRFCVHGAGATPVHDARGQGQGGSRRPA